MRSYLTKPNYEKYYKVIYTNTQGIADTPTMKAFLIHYRKLYFKYQEYCKKGIHKIGTPIYGKDVICVPVTNDITKALNPNDVKRSLRTLLKDKWDKPLIIPFIYYGDTFEEFKELIASLNINNTEIKIIGDTI